MNIPLKEYSCKFIMDRTMRSDNSAYDMERAIGQSLKSLRLAVGLTQFDLAQRLGVGQSTISKIEQRADIQLSTLQKYLKALGSHLQIDAIFPFHSNIALDDSYKNKNIWPIFRENPNIKRDIVLSIKPLYSKKIIKGIKTIELRRRFPLSTSRGTIIYIYSTSPVMALIGSAEIDNVERLTVTDLWRVHGKSASIRKIDFDNYFRGRDEGFALKITKPRKFMRPFYLRDLKEQFGFKAPQSFVYVKPELQKVLRSEHTILFNRYKCNYSS